MPRSQRAIGDLDVYPFYGDGTVSADEWNAGTFYQRVTGIGGDFFTGRIDVTPLVTNALSNHADYLSFVFRAGATRDRYWMYPFAGGPKVPPIATLEIALLPEPSTILLAAVGLPLLLRRRRKSVPHNRV